MTVPHRIAPTPASDPVRAARIDLAAAFRWAARMNLHETVANHFSLALDPEGRRVLINPRRHFSRMRASDLLEIDVTDPEGCPPTLDPTALGLHGGLHRLVPWARCAIHLHPPHATVLAALADSTLPPVDQNSAMFFNRVVIDEVYGGLAFADEGARCASLFTDPKRKVMVMGNHGVLVIGTTVAETFTRMVLFERAVGTYLGALQTGQPLRLLPDDIAEKTATEIEDMGTEFDAEHLAELKAILDAEGSDYAA